MSSAGGRRAPASISEARPNSTTHVLIDDLAKCGGLDSMDHRLRDSGHVRENVRDSPPRQQRRLSDDRVVQVSDRGRQPFVSGPAPLDLDGGRLHGADATTLWLVPPMRPAYVSFRAVSVGHALAPPTMRLPATAAAAKMDTMGRTDDEPTKNRPGHSAWPWLAGANLIGFAGQHLEIEGTSVLDRLVPSGAAIDSGELWRPLTSLVVHPGGWVHLGINTALLVITGPRTEAALGSRRFVATYLGAGSSANALRYVAGGRRGGGASAAIFAAAGAAGAAAVLRCCGRTVGREVPAP